MLLCHAVLSYSTAQCSYSHSASQPLHPPHAKSYIYPSHSYRLTKLGDKLYPEHNKDEQRHSLPLSWPNELRIHPRQVVIDCVLLQVLRPLLCTWLAEFLPNVLVLKPGSTCWKLENRRGAGLTGVSIHVRSWVSSAAHPATLNPDDAQQAVMYVSNQFGYFFPSPPVLITCFSNLSVSIHQSLC